MPLETIVAIYRRRWQIESLFKQIKQNFPLRYFYGESANAIKIQVWVTLIANLLLSVLQQTDKTLELLGSGHNGTNRADVLPKSRKVPQSTRRRPENNARLCI